MYFKIGLNKYPNKIWLYAKKVRYGSTGSTILGYDGDKCKVYGSYEDFENATSYKRS